MNKFLNKIVFAFSIINATFYLDYNISYVIILPNRRGYIMSKEVRIPTYRVEKEISLMESLPDSKPSKRIIKTKKGLKAIKALIDIQENHNTSWYNYLKEKNINNFDKMALFYRGNKITFRDMYKKADEIAVAMYEKGLEPGEEIGVCVSNTPELVYILLAANKLGLRVNLFGTSFDKENLSNILDNVSKKVMFISDDNYDEIKEIVKSKDIDNIVVSSLSTSLPAEPEKCDEYEEELDEYYHYEDKTDRIISEGNNIISFKDFALNVNSNTVVPNDIGDLETDFLVTYTSGSTKNGFPKEIIHKNRSLITMGRFHDSELSGNPKLENMRGLAHIHPESNTDIITCISDNLMQGWAVALEPEYSKEKVLDYIILNKPNYLNITTSFLLEAAKQYLIDKKYNKDGKSRKLPFLLATFAVGEKTSKGEEKYINKFLRKAAAGSGVSIKGFKMPYTTLSIGGGDCEHGGIYYTLWKSLQEKLHSPILGKKELGMMPVPYVVVTALRQDSVGRYVECDYDEPGIVVANSYSNLSCYKGNPEATKKLIITDKLGRSWVTTNTYGYIDKLGSVHINGRIPEKKNTCATYVIDDIVLEDTKNILSSTTVENEDGLLITIQKQPTSRMNDEKLCESIYNRLLNSIPYESLEYINIRIIPVRESMPLTPSGKRNSRVLEDKNFGTIEKLENYIKKEKQKKLIL